MGASGGWWRNAVVRPRTRKGALEIGASPYKTVAPKGLGFGV